NAAVRDIVTRTSADLPPVLRDLLEKTQVGHLTPPEQTKQGVEMVALCARNKTTVDTPKKKEIRDKMFVEKYEAKSKSYLQQVRNAAMTEYRGCRQRPLLCPRVSPPASGPTSRSRPGCAAAKRIFHHSICSATAPS